jgi:hypothetical protein
MSLNDGGAVLLHIPSGTYLSLDGSAVRVVELLNADPDPGRAAQNLAESFGISEDRAQSDVLSVIQSVRGLSAPRLHRGRRPTLAGSSAVIHYWRRLPWRLRLAVFRASLVVGLIELGLRFSDLDRLSRFLRVPLATNEVAPPAMEPDDLSGFTDDEVRLYWAIHWVMARWLYDGTCLRQALALGWFLRKRMPVLRLGMLDGDRAVAHAWIEVAGRSFNVQPVSGTFRSGVGPPK